MLQRQKELTEHWAIPDLGPQRPYLSWILVFRAIDIGGLIYLIHLRLHLLFLAFFLDPVAAIISLLGSLALRGANV